MKKNIFILIFMLLSTTVFSQSFTIPGKRDDISTKTSKFPKPGTPTKARSGSQPTNRPKLKSSQERQQDTGLQPMQTMTSPPDITTGRQVEGIERSQSIGELEVLASQGDIDAHTMLGMYYFMQDDERALPHLIAGAEAGDSRAQYYLGGVYYFGKFGTEADKAAAASYYLKSAQKGHVPAQYGIAVCLYNGEGVEQDRQAAREWMEKAAQNNDEDAKAFLKTHTFD